MNRGRVGCRQDICVPGGSGPLLYTIGNDRTERSEMEIEVLFSPSGLTYVEDSYSDVFDLLLLIVSSSGHYSNSSSISNVYSVKKYRSIYTHMPTVYLSVHDIYLYMCSLIYTDTYTRMKGMYMVLRLSTRFTFSCLDTFVREPYVRT